MGVASAGQQTAGSGVATAASGRRLVCCVSLVTAIWSVSLLKWVWTGSTVPWDAKNQFYAFFRFLAQALHTGQSPFWNPYHYGGHPALADPQSLILSPLFLVWAWLDPAPSMRVFDALAYSHLLIGGVAIAFLGERRNWPIAATVLTAGIFMLGASAASRLNHTGIIAIFGLMPLALLTLEVALERNSLPAACGFAVIASIILLGRNQVALLVSLLLCAAAARDAMLSGRPVQFLADRWQVFAVMGGIIAVICIVPLLLTLEFASLSNRPEMDLPTALGSSLHPANLVTLAIPDAFGSQTADLAYWGPSYLTTPGSAATDVSFNYLFVGVVPVTLLIWLGISCGGIAKSGGRVWGGVLIFALAFAAGRYTPVFSLLFEQFPGISFFRRPNDATFLIGAALAFLAGHVLADFMEQGRAPARRGPALIALAMCVGVVASAFSVASVTRHAPALATEIAGALPLALAVIVATMVMRGRHQRVLAGSGLTAVALMELLTWNVASPLNAEAGSYYRLLERPRLGEHHPLDDLRAEISRRHRDGARPRVEITGLGGPWQNAATAFGIEATTGYNPLRIGLYDRFVVPGESPADPAGRQFPASFSDYGCSLARALGVEYLVLDRPLEKLTHLRKRPKAEPIRLGPDIWIYRLRPALPRVSFQPRIRVADVDATNFGALRNPPRSDLAVIDDETPPSKRLWLNRASGAHGEAKIVDWKTTEVVIDVNSKAAGVVVLHDNYYPGWIAEVDGQLVPILRADVLFRAVEVPAGRHRVRFRFEPLRFAHLMDAFHKLAHPQAPRYDDDWWAVP
jgi:hypothetical protein